MILQGWVHSSKYHQNIFFFRESFSRTEAENARVILIAECLTGLSEVEILLRCRASRGINHLRKGLLNQCERRIFRDPKKSPEFYSKTLHEGARM